MPTVTQSIQIDLGVSRPATTFGTTAISSVDGLLSLPTDAETLYVIAHGAGAGMEHSFMSQVSEGLAERRIATLRFNFPYWQSGSRRPDRPPVLQRTIIAATQQASSYGLPLVAGGKSMGGRLTGYAAAAGDLPLVRGLVFLGFPLHPADQPDASRWQPMVGLATPCLFIQGDRDRLADLDLLRPRIESLESADLHIVEGGDHGFQVLKRSGRTDQQAIDEICDITSRWILGRLSR